MNSAAQYINDLVTNGYEMEPYEMDNETIAMLCFSMGIGMTVLLVFLAWFKSIL